MKEIVNKLTELSERIKKAIPLANFETKRDRLGELEKELLNSSFWQRDDAKTIMQKIDYLKKYIKSWEDLEKETEELLELSKVTKENEHKICSEIKEKAEKLETHFDKMEFQLLLSGEHDESNALLSIYSGSGGTDACDWSEMLLRMYLRFCEKEEYETKILHISPASEAGIKSVTVEVVGPYAYGYLKGESGVHRLVRISPFDADKARHTSFSLVDILPEVEDVEVKIDERDLRTETFRARGHGGQSVNTTDSAVRITHIPTGITASCQNERSQLQNKKTALKILKSKIHIFEERKRRKEISEIRGESISAEWGNQIRSYVLHPYSKVKDHRTGFESNNPQSVLDGEIDEFIEAYLRKETRDKK